MSKRILIVDDSESIRELVGLTLESSGYSVEKGVDGLDAMRFLDGSEIDLVITDLNMPNVDGIQLIREIRKTSRSEEHTSELQSLAYLVCRLLLEKKKKNFNIPFANKKKKKRK